MNATPQGSLSALESPPPSITWTSRPHRAVAGWANRQSFLVGLYAVTWLLIHLCCGTYFRSLEASPGSSPALFLWVGLLLSQLGSSLMWQALSTGGQIARNLIAVGGLVAASPLLSQSLTGTSQDWWQGLVVMLVGTQASWWALQRPLGGWAAKPTRPWAAYSLLQWLTFSLWLAMVLNQLPTWTSDVALSAGLITCFGGLSIFVAVHRLAFQQFFWPAEDSWPGRQASLRLRMLDRLGILVILAGLHALLAWGLWHYYGADPKASGVWGLCLVASAWQACDLGFERLVYNQT